MRFIESHEPFGMSKGDYPKYDSTEGDYYCSVCSEPWEAYSIRRLEDDWTTEQVAAFKAGLGCPGCLKDEELAKLGREVLAKQRGPQVCDGCLMAAWDEGAGPSMEDTKGIHNLQMSVCIQMGADIHDHICEDPGRCACACPKPAQIVG